jgi:hypothetical protein
MLTTRTITVISGPAVSTVGMYDLGRHCTTISRLMEMQVVLFANKTSPWPTTRYTITRRTGKSHHRADTTRDTPNLGDCAYVPESHTLAEYSRSAHAVLEKSRCLTIFTLFQGRRRCHRRATRMATRSRRFHFHWLVACAFTPTHRNTYPGWRNRKAPTGGRFYLRAMWWNTLMVILALPRPQGMFTKRAGWMPYFQNTTIRRILGVVASFYQLLNIISS